jgi:DNA-binding winged helix-turn-helix (wHTH) protein/TolB-like protein/Flp pilus assembly protein TadD
LENQALYQFGEFQLDAENHLFSSGAGPLALTPKAFEVLLVLVENGNRLTTKEELMKRVWPDSFVEEANLTVNISALRKVLGEMPDGRPYIETVTKKGYRFVAPVRVVETQGASTEGGGGAAEVEELKESRAAAVATPIGAGVSPSRRRVRWSGRAISLLVVFAAAIAIAFFMSRGRISIKRIAPPEHRLAVLPFQNLRANTESDFLGFSLADAVITKLGYVSRLAVRPSYAVQKYRTQPVDVGKIARDLNVDTLLIGTFLREGDDLRITCQLVDIKTQNILWKDEYDVKYDKLLTVQDTVANQIIAGLAVSLSESEQALLKKQKTISPLAYEYYLRGIDLYASSDFPMAIRMLEKSTELAPDYALGWANLGRSYTANASFQLGGGEQYGKAQRAFERALKLEPDSIDARVYMANMFTDTGRVEKAVPLLRDALKTNPNHAEVHWELGYAYRFGGMLRESITESEEARRLDPVVKMNSSALNGYLYLGQYDEFLQSLPPTDDSALIVFYRGFGHYYKNNLGEAGKYFDRASQLDRSLLQAQIGKALSLGIQRRTAEAAAILRGVEERINQLAVGDAEAKYKIAQAYAVLGEKAAALRVFRTSIESGFFPYPYFLNDPLLNNIRCEPEFTRILDAAKQRHQGFAATFFS